MHLAPVWGEVIVNFCRFFQCYPTLLSIEVHRSWLFCLLKLKGFQGLENTVMVFSNEGRNNLFLKFG